MSDVAVIMIEPGVQGPPALKPISVWATGQIYNKSPYASFVGIDGSSYECLITHTSGVFETDVAAGKWGLVAASGSLTEEGVAASNAAIAAAASAGGDAAATAADRTAIRADAIATAADRSATAADRVQTGQDRAAASSSAAAAATSAGSITGAVAATAADRVQTGQDAASTAADRTAVHTEKLATDANAVAAAASATAAASNAKQYSTLALANAAIAGLSTTDQIEVYADGANNGLYVKTTAGASSLTKKTGSTVATLDARVSPLETLTTILKASTSLASAPPVTLAVLGSLTVTSASFSALVSTVIDLGHAAAFNCLVRSLSAEMATALAGRTGEFYVLRPSGGSNTVIWASGILDVSALGVTTYTVPDPTQLRMLAGDVIGFWNSATTGTDGLKTAASGGPTIGSIVRSNVIQGHLTVGAVVTAGAGNFVANTVYAPHLAASVVHEAILLPTTWGNLAGGPLLLSSQGRIPIPQLPRHLGFPSPATVANGASEVTSYDPALKAQKRSIRRKPLLSQYIQASPNANSDTTNTYPQNTVIINWVNGAVGFGNKGLLTRLRIPPGGAVGSNATIQAWVVRPVSGPPTSGSASFTLVATIGEITAAPNTDWREFSDLAIEVEAGDLIALRGINSGLRFGSGAAFVANDYYVYATAVTDMSLAALDNGLTATVFGGRRFDLQADVIIGSAALPPMRVETDGTVSLENVRAPDAPWAGKKVGWFGTSIPAGGGDSTGLGYPGRMQPWLQCQMDNQSVGSSGIVWDGTRALSLGATRAELTAAGFDPNQSYETKLLGKSYDLVVFDHGYNDRTYSIGTSADTTPATFWGAYKRVIGALLSENPATRFCFITPISLYSPSYPTFSSQTAAIRTAMLAMADYFGAPILDWTGKSGMGAYAPTPSILTLDGVHPTDLVHGRAARIGYDFLRGI